MITPQEFITQWQGELIKNTPDSLENINLPKVSKLFLIEAGLPRWVPGLELNFDRLQDEMPTLPEAFPNGYDFPEDYSCYYPIGADPATLLCLDAHHNGSIYSIDIDDNGVPTRFVNSSVPHLAEFLLVIQVIPSDGPPKVHTDEEGAAYTEELAHKFKSIDPEAMRDADSYWSSYLEATLI